MGIVITGVFYINSNNITKNEVKIKIENIKKDININQATYDELLTVKGIGPSTANKIIEYRTNKGYFKEIGELVNIKGIGTVKCNKLKELVICK